MFDGFKLEHVDVGEVRPRVRHGGARQPVVLPHGHPRTHSEGTSRKARIRGRLPLSAQPTRCRLRYGDLSLVVWRSAAVRTLSGEA